MLSECAPVTRAALDEGEYPGESIQVECAFDETKRTRRHIQFNCRILW